MRTWLVTPALVLALSSPLAAQRPASQPETLAYLQKLHHADGGFAPASTARAASPSSLRATLGAVRALRYFGGQLADREATRAFCERCFDRETGGFADRPGGKSDVPTTAVGLMAAVELELPLDRYREPALAYLMQHAKGFEDIRIAAAGLEAIHARPAQATAWLKEIQAMRNSDGTYGSGSGQARATGGAVVAVLRLGGEIEQRDQVVAALKAGQRADGGFGKADAAGSDLDSCYRIMRAFAMLKIQPDADRLRTFVASCRNADGGYGVTPGERSTVSGTYEAGIILHWLERK